MDSCLTIRKALIRGAVIGLALASAIATAATFNLFSPATGVLKGNASTYITAPAASSDIASLWSGACSSSTYLRGDGQCQTPPGTGGGTVNSVSMSAPSVFSVAGSPITNTGTLALTFATGQTANQVLATPNGSTGAVSLRSIVGADLPAINLAASGAGGVTGNLPVANLNSGTSASSTTFWRGDGTWSTPLTSTPAGSNTQVQYNNSGAFGASGSFTWDAGSNVLNLGASTTPGTYSVGSLASMTISGVALAVPSFASNSNIQGNVEVHSYTSATPAAGSVIYGVRARGSISSPTAVASGDNLLTLGAAGLDGTGYTWGAHIHFLADGTPSAGVLPGALDFQTTPSASNTPASVLKLDHAGSYWVNGSQGTAGNVLTSGGTGATAWGTVNLASANAVTGVLTVPNGGTGVGTLTGLALGNGTAAFGPYAGTSCTNQFPRSLNANGAATCASVALAADVSGNLPVANLDSGTGASSTTFWRGDGTWAAPAGVGTVTSVALTAPGIFTVSGSPVTSSGTLALTATGTSGGIPYFSSTTGLGSSALLAANQLMLGGGAATAPATLGSLGTTATVLHGNAAGAPTFGAVSLTADVSGLLPVANGGTGVGTLTGYVKGSGTSAFTASATIPYSDLTGTPTIPTGANPTATVGTAAVNGSASTFMRSDAAPALNLAISPTWTGNHTFAPSSGSPITAGVNSASGLVVNATGASVGVLVNGAAATQITGMSFGQSGQTQWSLYQPSSSSDFRLYGGSDRLIVTSGGNFTINAPSSGGHLFSGNYDSSVPAAGSKSSLATFANGGAWGINLGTLNTGVGYLQSQRVDGTAAVYGLLIQPNGGGTQVGAPTGGDKGDGTINAQGLYVNGVAVSTGSGGIKSAAAIITSSSNCSISTNVNSSIASCTYNGTGDVTVTFTGSWFATTPACTVTSIAGVATLMYISTSSSSSVRVLSKSTGNSASDSGFHLTCMGT